MSVAHLSHCNSKEKVTLVVAQKYTARECCGSFAWLPVRVRELLVRMFALTVAKEDAKREDLNVILFVKTYSIYTIFVAFFVTVLYITLNTTTSV